MRLTLLTPPDPFVVWADADTHLRLDGDTGQKTYVEGLITAATTWAERWCGRAFAEQTWEAVYDRLPLDTPDRLFLPLGPLVSVDAVEYQDEDDAQQTWAVEDYAVYGVGSDSGSIAPVPDGSWPTIYSRPEALRVEFTVGQPADDITQDIRAAILLIVGELHANRENAVITQGSLIRTEAAERLLAPYRVWRA